MPTDPGFDNEQVVCEHGDSVWRVIVRLLGDDGELAEECFQETFTQFFERCRSGGTPEHTGAMLSRIASRRAIDAIRSRVRDRSRMQVIDETTIVSGLDCQPTIRAEANELLADLRVALAELPEKQATAFFCLDTDRGYEPWTSWDGPAGHREPRHRFASSCADRVAQATCATQFEFPRGVLVMSVTEMNSSENDCLELAAKEMRSIAVEPVPQRVIQRTLLATSNNRRPANQGSSSHWWTIAASVALIAAVMVVTMSLLLPGSSTVLADVVANAIQAKSVSFVQQIQLNGRTPAEAWVQVQGDALRCEFTNGVVWVEDSSRQQGVFLDVDAKQAAKRELHEPSSNQSRWQTDPMQWLRRLKPTDARWLGERRVDGRPADLFSGKVSGVFTQGTDSYGFAPDHAIRIWVDRETDLPLRIEIRSPGGSESIAFSKIQWNEQIAEARFSLEVPDGFDVVPPERFLKRFPQTTVLPTPRP